MNNAMRLARAVLLFHDAEPWNTGKAALWQELTGNANSTTKGLCDLARRIHMEETDNARSTNQST